MGSGNLSNPSGYLRVEHWPTKDIKPRMTPGHEHTDEILGDFFLRKEHFEGLTLEDLFQVLEFKGRCNPKHAVAVKTIIRTENVAVGVEPQEIPKGLYGDGRAWDRIALRHSLLKKGL